LRDKFAAIAVLIDHLEYRRRRMITGQMNPRAAPIRNERVVRLDDQWIEAEIVDDGGFVRISNGTNGAADWKIETDWVPGRPVWQGKVNGEETVVQLRRISTGYRLSHRGAVVGAHVFTQRQAELARLMPVKSTSNSSKRLLCPMPGLVVSVIVRDGQDVKAGEPLAVIEAMKMENILRAERDGTIKTVHVRKGDSLAADSVIMEFA
jgi:propionyl-CoA carboxylase alpha chain